MATKKRTRKANPKAVAALKKIVAKAKIIRKANPRKKWTTCIKEASKK
jgi:hypothetical protein